MLAPAEAAAASSFWRSLCVTRACLRVLRSVIAHTHDLCTHGRIDVTHPSPIRSPWNACSAATAACTPRSTTPASHPARSSTCGADATATAPVSRVDAVGVVMSAARGGRGRGRLKRAEYQKRFQKRSGQSSSIVSR